MLFLSIIHHYLAWHYAKALAEIWHVAKNLLWFVVHFFSLPQLVKAYFAPYRRMTEGRGNTFNFEDLAGYIIINLISRIIGLILRTTIIISGVFCLIVLITLIITTFLIWLVAPAFILGSLVLGLKLLLAI